MLSKYSLLCFILKCVKFVQTKIFDNLIEKSKACLIRTQKLTDMFLQLPTKETMGI